MSSERSTNPNRPLKPSLASTRTARTPIAPRVAGNATPPTKLTASRPTPTIRSEPPTPRAKQPTTPIKDVLANGNVTPRSSARTSRPGSANASPKQADGAGVAERPKTAGNGKVSSAQQNGNAGIVAVTQDAQPKRPTTSVSDNGGGGAQPPPLLRSPGFFDLSPRAPDESIESKFFHASDAPKQDPKKPQFFHANGRQEGNNLLSSTQSPVLSAISEQRSAGPWIRSENSSRVSRSPPLCSPASSAVSGVSPFFVPASAPQSGQISPSQSKENIHLSYRKGASQIIGTRPTTTPPSMASDRDIEPSSPGISRHHKSPSLSSITSINSLQSRRRSTTTGEAMPSHSPLAQEFTSATAPRVIKPLQDLPSIDTSLESPRLSRTESGLSPTKAGSELAAEARRERKVLDLEISNSSLMAINTSLEREVRRQKAELKRFRRLSRAGRFSVAPGERMRTLSEDLSALTEENEDDEYFGLGSGSPDDISDDEDDLESVASSAEPLSAAAAQDRLAKDEKRLQIDLEKHKELLMQSQAMNQSIKRCMYATEDMISEGKKALEYHVRVSDVKLGGRVLSTHADDADAEGGQQIEVEDDVIDGDGDGLEKAQESLDAGWTDVGRQSLDSSESGGGGGDRDSGIEVDRPPTNGSLPLAQKMGDAGDSGRPPGLIDLGRFGSFS